MKTLRAVWRLVAFLSALVWYAAPLWVRGWLGEIDWDHHQRTKQRFCRKALQILGVDLLVEGQPYAEGSCVYTSNHRSWLDPFAELATVWAWPVAKAEVGSLPIVAEGARATGILFVDRADKSSRRAVLEAMIEALREGFSVLIYPEGTTSTEQGTIAYRRGAFAVAEESGRPVVPLAVVYPDPSYHWGEGESLWANYVQVAGERRTRLRLIIGEPVKVGAAASERVMGQVRAWTDARIAEGMT